MEYLLVAVALFVAFSNGANDNFKGFATVWGSDTLSYRDALLLATLASAAGSLASLLLAEGLVQQFSGRGLVPAALASTPRFLLGVAGGAAATVFLATRLGFPISTTHALIGGLCGAGLAMGGGALRLDALAQAFLLPLLASPLLAAALGLLAYRVLRRRAPAADCACVLPLRPAGVDAPTLPLPTVVVASDAVCERLDAPLRISVGRNLDRLHILSALAICFARAVNDTPKLAALLIAAQVFQARSSVVLIGLAMGVGGLLFSRRVAETMSRRVARIDHAQGVTGNSHCAAMRLAPASRIFAGAPSL